MRRRLCARSLQHTARRRVALVTSALTLSVSLCAAHLRSSADDGCAQFFPAFSVPSHCSRPQLRGGHLVSSGGYVSKPSQLGRPSSSDADAEVVADVASEAEVSTPPLQASANLAKNIVGSGMLSLPAGIAAFASGPNAILPAILTLVLPLGLLSAYTFYLVGWICEQTGTQSYGEAWSKTLGEKSGSLITLVVLLSCATGCVAYAMILGDTLYLLLKPLTSAAIASRSSIISLITIFILYPLSRLKNLAPLGKFSLVGTFGSVFVALFTAIRFFQGSYAPGGRFASSVAKAAAGTASKSPVDALILASILSTAFIAHFNSPRMYKELETPAKGTSKLQRFSQVVLSGFSVAMVLYSMVMAFGFLTFGNSCLGNVLDNYAAADPLAGVAKAAVAISLLFGHPLQFLAYRDGVEGLSGMSGQLLSAGLLASCTILAILLRDLGKLQALQGAIGGTFLVFIGPSVMAAKLTRGRARARHLLVA
eukprot:CAMPEP_0178434608 /NCGR_PEP_ID=MMETSP0689_2-20121128/33509_1 /TAXON_ID=160604 /ORGANISM="Amphidinium massartii, Strain CS-259" /LENGTH=480 /DNA_ID=CAMNT_0020056673 /DNA_START=30 /DNA_END=1469 /DNA_ORIENTATION=+